MMAEQSLDGLLSGLVLGALYENLMNNAIYNMVDIVKLKA